MEVDQYLKAVIESDEAPIVICDLENIIVYINKSASLRYASAGGNNLLGKSIKCCHSKFGNEKIDEIVSWFKMSKDNNIVYTYYNEKENKDVYVIALRSDDDELIGYYEKHSFRNKEIKKLYDYS